MDQSLSKSNRGASLIEALIGIAVGSLLIISGISLLNVSLRTGVQNKYLQGAAFLGSDLMTKVSAYVDRKWLCIDTPGCGIYNLNKGQGYHYQIKIGAGASFVSEAGDETGLVVDGTSYTRYFYVENVLRDASGAIVLSGGSEDPSTQKITVVVVWPGGGKIENVKYVTRSRNIVLHQTDWSGCSVQTDCQENFPATGVNNKFDSAENFDTTEAGSIKIIGL